MKFKIHFFFTGVEMKYRHAKGGTQPYSRLQVLAMVVYAKIARRQGEPPGKNHVCGLQLTGRASKVWKRSIKCYSSTNWGPRFYRPITPSDISIPIGPMYPMNGTECEHIIIILVVKKI